MTFYENTDENDDYNLELLNIGAKISDLLQRAQELDLCPGLLLSSESGVSHEGAHTILDTFLAGMLMADLTRPELSISMN